MEMFLFMCQNDEPILIVKAGDYDWQCAIKKDPQLLTLDYYTIIQESTDKHSSYND